MEALNEASATKVKALCNPGATQTRKVCTCSSEDGKEELGPTHHYRRKSGTSASVVIRLYPGAGEDTLC